MRQTIKYLSTIFAFVLLLSCSSREKIVYIQNADNISGKNDAVFFETKLQPDDLLMIHVGAKDSESAAEFNLEAVSVSQAGTATTIGQRNQLLYLVDNLGNIDFPVLGKIKVGGLTRGQLVNLLKEKLADYIQNPIVNMRIMNFRVSVLGEVNRPGSYTFNSERSTVFDALSLAGDLTIYGVRKNIILIRENEGKKTSHRIDITSADFVNSNLYYLKQNDVIYVEPNKTRVNAAAVGPNISVIISAVSLLITIIALTVR